MNAKDLEVWTLQTICDAGILLSVTTFVLHSGRSYFERTVRQLQAKMAEEMWWVTYLLVRDVSLFAAVLIGFLMLNPDIMADIKIGLPWVPLAMVLMAVALVIRAFHGGRVVASTAWWIVFGLVVVACAANWFGFTFVMEAAGEGYLKNHSGSVWPTLQRMRSDFNPDLAMATFQWVNPALLLVFLWAVVTGAVRSCRARQQPKAGHDA